MFSKLLKKDEGFTLIEIVLVLAIAGLIMVIVFLAVSGAQKARRDTQRKNDLSRVGTMLEQFASNNDGKYPEDPALAPAVPFTTFVTNYKIDAAAGNFKDPLSGAIYTFALGTSPTIPAGSTSAGVSYDFGKDCQGVAAGNRVYALYIGLENGVKDCRTNK